ncbi:MAG: peptidoglycan-binding domain-containing protein [Pikeienuella sp.]
MRKKQPTQIFARSWHPRRAQGAATGSGAVGTESLVPPNAKPGECYARITQPAKFKTVSEKVIATEASDSVSIVPATYKTVQERVLVSEASERLEVIPATYKTVEERILVTPAKTTLTKVAPKFKTVEERVLVKEAYTTWKRGGNVIAVGQNALGGTILENRTSDTGEVMCLVEVPAEYRVVTKRVKVSDGGTRETTTPAVYRTVKKRVVDQPATTRKITIPAKYATVTKTVEVTPATTRTTTTPATYKTVTKTVNAAPARTVWTSVLCDVNTTPDVVRRLQTALKRAGHYGGPIDGIVGSQTRAGIKSYQGAQGVRSDILTIESAKKLGII